MIANSLFHFTRKSTSLKAILQSSSLRASYCIENVRDFGFQSPYLAIPMVCFCDIPLKFVRHHVLSYGGYGIGLKKDWGIDSKINPLQYVVSSSFVAKSMKELIESAKAENFIVPGESVAQTQRRITQSITIQDRIVRIATFTKVYEEKRTNFYLEREWRYVPGDCQFSFTNKRNKKITGELNLDYHSTSPDHVPFEVEDINHIIVPTSSAIKSVIKVINKLQLDQTVRSQLIQKIIDLKTIQNDF
jgi:hypothetical protein